MKIFIVPVILLNEIAGRKAGGFVQGILKRIGADIVEKPQISRVAISKPSENEKSEG